MRVGDIDDAKTMRKPGDRNLGAGDFLAKLMHAGVIELRRTVLLRHLETGKWDRLTFVWDIDDPEKGRRGHFEPYHVLVRDQHDPSSAHWKRNEQSRVSGPGKRWAPIEPRY